MKVYVIIMLSFGIVRGLMSIIKSVDEDEGSAGITGSILYTCSTILAVIFACIIFW